VLEDARRFYQTLKSSAERRGREADDIRILPGILPIIGETDQAAREIAAMLAERIDVAAGRQSLSSFLADVDLSGLALDEPIPTAILPRPEDVEGGRSRYGLFYAMAQRDGYTLRQLIYERVIASGHLVVIGTAQQVADKMEEWFRAGACDGFNIEVSHLGAGLDALTDGLVPELRARGLFRTHYAEGGTLRGNLGLPRPAGRRP
jgi:N-acetyl-S-(2-succino)cysteine monooxygenase